MCCVWRESGPRGEAKAVAAAAAAARSSGARSMCFGAGEREREWLEEFVDVALMNHFYFQALLRRRVRVLLCSRGCDRGATSTLAIYHVLAAAAAHIARAEVIRYICAAKKISASTYMCLCVFIANCW